MKGRAFWRLLPPALLAAAVACGGDPEEPAPSSAPAPRPSTAGEACLDCHEDVVRAWRETPMARAVSWIEPGELAGLNTVEEPESGYSYHFEEKPGQPPLLVETRAAGHRLELPLAFAIGAGVLDRSYVAVHGRTLWFAPIEVISAHGARPRHAALAPGNMIVPGTRTSIPITEECLGCHTDDPPPRGWPLNLVPETWEPKGISCGACHGRVEEHARWQELDLQGADNDGDDPVLRQANLSREERMSICAACHLQGDARIVLDPDELGPPPPGGDLLEQRALYVAAEPTNDVGFVSHVERLLLSRCYLESDTLTCETCHDPHRSLEPTQSRAACVDCHPAAHADDAAMAEGDCVSCHMRTTPVFDVAGVEITDHFIRAEPGPPSVPGPIRFPESPTGDWKRVRWPGVPPPAHVDDPGLLMMAFAHRGHIEAARELVDVPPGPGAAPLPMYHHVRGSLLEGAERWQEAYDAYKRALELDPDLAASATNLGFLCGKLNRPKEGLALLDAVIEKHPLATGALRDRAVLREAMGDREGFVRDVERAHAVHPDATLAAALAKFFTALGEGDLARRWRAEARRLDPVRHP